MTGCDGEYHHLVCCDCAKTYVETLMGDLKCRPECMADTECKGTYTRAELQRFLPATSFERLGKLQQEDDLLKSGLEFEECPFCDFKMIIEVDIEIDREFRCIAEDCRQVSCRMCKKKSHVPKSCVEAKEDEKLDHKHAVEEARSEAAIRLCNKCKTPFFKEFGCNKMTCSKCGNKQCYICNENVKDYGHFNNPPRGTQTSGATKASCPLHDHDMTAAQRDEARAKAAEEAVIAKIREARPDISEEELKVNLPESTTPTQDELERLERGHLRQALDMARQRNRLEEAMVIQDAARIFDRANAAGNQDARNRLLQLRGQFMARLRRRAQDEQGARRGAAEAAAQEIQDIRIHDGDEEPDEAHWMGLAAEMAREQEELEQMVRRIRDPAPQRPPQPPQQPPAALRVQPFLPAQQQNPQQQVRRQQPAQARAGQPLAPDFQRWDFLAMPQIPPHLLDFEAVYQDRMQRLQAHAVQPPIVPAAPPAIAIQIPPTAPPRPRAPYHMGADGANRANGPFIANGSNGGNSGNGANTATARTGTNGPLIVNGSNNANVAHGPNGSNGVNGANARTGANGARDTNGGNGLSGRNGVTGAYARNGPNVAQWYGFDDGNGANAGNGVTGANALNGPNVAQWYGLNGAKGGNGADSTDAITDYYRRRGINAPNNPNGQHNMRANGRNAANGQQNTRAAPASDGSPSLVRDNPTQ